MVDYCLQRLVRTCDYAEEVFYDGVYPTCVKLCKWPGSNRVGFGYDEGAVMIKLGREEPVASMDANGKIIYAKHNEVKGVNVKAASDSDLTDGERLPLPVKDMGSSDVYPQVRTLVHKHFGLCSQRLVKF